MTLPSLKGIIPDLAEQAIRSLHRELQAVQRQMAVPAPLPVIDHNSIASELQAGGRAPINVNSLLGQLAQAQIPYAPVVTALPPASDPQSQNGSLVIFQNLLYQYNATTEPGAWSNIGALVLANTTTVTRSANATTKQFLMQTSLAAGFLNSLGRVLRLSADGFYTTQAGQTPTFQFDIGLDASGGPPVYLSRFLTFGPTAATTAATTDGRWQFDAIIVVTAAGATAQVESWGKLAFQPADVTAASPVFYQDMGQASATFNAAATHSLDVTVTISTQPGADPRNQVSQRALVIERMN